LQGKALAVLIVLAAAALLAGCGGGGGSTSTQRASSKPASNGEGGQRSAGAEGPLKHVRKRVQELRRSREREERAHGAAPAAASPKLVHHDSGGGAAQFRSRGGDNSIQESGVEAGPAERERAAAALHAYLDLRAAHHWGAACEYMSASLIVLLEQAVAISPRSQKPKGCPAVLAAMSKAVPQRLLDELTEVDVGSFRQNGNRGFLLYHGPEGKDYAMMVVKEAGGWKMASLDGTVLP
jgi:hypothetical protein